MAKPLTSILIVLVLGCCYSTPAQTDLPSLIAQLQKTPTDNAVRERIIKLAASMRPAPEVPEDARRPFIKANTAIKTATGPESYASAIRQYQEALAIAPWWGDPYYNLARAEEMHKDYDLAIQSLKFYLLSAPESKDAREAQDHIYELEQLRDSTAQLDKKAADDAANAKAAADKAAQAETERRKNSVEGKWGFVSVATGEPATYAAFTISRAGNALSVTSEAYTILDSKITEKTIWLKTSPPGSRNTTMIYSLQRQGDDLVGTATNVEMSRSSDVRLNRIP